MESNTFNEVKEFFLGLFVLLLFIVALFLPMVLGMFDNPAMNQGPSKYHCKLAADGTVQCLPTR